MAPFTIQQIRDAEAKYQETYQRVKERFQGKTAAEIVKMIPASCQVDRGEITKKLQYVIAGSDTGFYDLSQPLSTKAKSAKATPKAVSQLSSFFNGNLETYFSGTARYERYTQLLSEYRKVWLTYSQEEAVTKQAELSKASGDERSLLEESGNLSKKRCSPGIDNESSEIYLSENQLTLSTSQRNRAFRELRVDQIHHPLLDALKKLPIRYFDTLKGAAVFYRLADDFKKPNSPYQTLIKDRNLTVIEPASGNVLSPLILIARLIDNDQIQSAEMTLTEGNPDFIGAIDAQLLFLENERIITDYKFLNPKEFSSPAGKSEGTEYYFSFKYKGKEIKITYALNRSGNDLWSKNQVEKGGLVVFLDLSSDDLHEYSNLFNKLKADKNPQSDLYLVTEGRRSKKSKTLGPMPGQFEYHPTTSFQEIKGTYGHCEQGAKIFFSPLRKQGVIREVEYQQCSYSSAMVIPVR